MVTLTLHKAIQPFQETHQLVHHQTEFGCIRISSSEDMVRNKTKKQSYFDYRSPNCDFDLEDSKTIFLRDSLAHDDAASYQVWLQNVSPFRRHHPHSHRFNENLNLQYDLEHSNAVFHRIPQFIIMQHQTKLGCKRIIS